MLESRALNIKRIGEEKPIEYEGLQKEILDLLEEIILEINSVVMDIEAYYKTYHPEVVHIDNATELGHAYFKLLGELRSFVNDKNLHSLPSVKIEAKDLRALKRAGPELKIYVKNARQLLEKRYT